MFSSAVDRGSSRRPRPLFLLAAAMVILLLVVVAMDRIANTIAEGRLASTIQASEGLDERPLVRINGFPFLTQVLRGRYRSVTLTSAQTIEARGIQVEQATATLTSVSVRASDALHGTVADVPVGSGRGSAVIPYSSVNEAVRQYAGAAGRLVSVGAAGPGQARVTGPLGLSVRITAQVTGGELVITPSADDLTALPGPVSAQVSSVLATPVPLPAFPFNVRLADGAFETDGLHVSATSRHSVFPVR